MGLEEQNLVVNTLTLAAIVTAVGVLWKVAVSGRRLVKSLGQFLGDWTGEPARPGHAARPGIPQRLERLEVGQAEIRQQLRVTGGDSLRDAVDRIPPNDTDYGGSRP